MKEGQNVGIKQQIKLPVLVFFEVVCDFLY